MTDTTPDARFADDGTPTRLDAPLDHVVRPALPWRREQTLTECGLVIEPGRRIITRDELVARINNLGQRRAAFTTCITCWETARRWKNWAEDPVEALSRETGAWHNRNRGQLRDELIALTTLVEAHYDEFEAILAGLRDAPRLADQRAARRERQLRGHH
jgi:hypothetical protein